MPAAPGGTGTQKRCGKINVPMSEDDKSEIRVEDRRHFDKEGNPISQEEGKTSTETEERRAEPRRSTGPPPKIDFASLVKIYVQSALVHMGELEDPVEHKTTENLEAARQMIDIIELLRDKTKGNLTPQEDHYVEGVLFDLRMRY